MDIDINKIEVLRSIRRMELKAKAAFCGGIYVELGPAVIGTAESVPDPHFNRISIVEPEKFDESVLSECVARMTEGAPMFIDTPHPVSEAIMELFHKNDLHPTGESRSSMLLTGDKDISHKLEEFDIEFVEPDTLDTFLDIFLRGFDTPQDIIPLAMNLFRELVIRHSNPGNCLLYLGVFQGEPAATQYLYHEGEEGGINMVSTKEQLRGKGLASSMISRVIDDCRELGIELLSLETRWDSAPERLYRRLGFETIMRHEVFTNVPDLKYGL